MMDFLFGEGKKKYYEIEFRRKPAQMLKWEPDQLVTRANFISLFVKSFELSNGIPSLQVLFLDWVELKTGLDYKETLKNFMMNPWGNLSEEEQKYFSSNFINVARHSRKLAGFQKDPANSILRQIIPLLSDDEESVNNSYEILAESELTNKRLLQEIPFSDLVSIIKERTIQYTRESKKPKE